MVRRRQGARTLEVGPVRRQVWGLPVCRQGLERQGLERQGLRRVSGGGAPPRRRVWRRKQRRGRVLVESQVLPA